MGRMPFPVHKIGTWVGKTGNIDIIAQSTDRRNIVGLCNWDQPQLTSQMCEELYQNMEKAKIRSEHIFYSLQRGLNRCWQNMPKRMTGLS